VLTPQSCPVESTDRIQTAFVQNVAQMSILHGVNAVAIGGHYAR
jgi:hypothetical protein